MSQSSPAGTICSLKSWITLIISLFICISIHGQVNSTYSILVAGHAYGAHAGLNIGLHPPLLNKLKVRPENIVAALILTGDIVNHSTPASWAQVALELSNLQLPAYYVMGNHDNNSTGMAVFQKKHGGTYYSFTIQNDLYIVLNSTESDRSISIAQLAFLNNLLQNTASTNKRVFIFFHELIWDSHEIYKLVRSNERSRYNEIVKVSNFWQKVYPALTAYPDKHFYLFAGDVGGNPDAVAAFYDRWANVTLLASGMGEVPDENYLEVSVLPDTVLFKLIPLNDAVEMKPITWYTIPQKPLSIEGPLQVNPPEMALRYKVSPVSNATSYRWTFSNGISGASDSSAINLGFDTSFQTGQIMARAVNDGFGESEPATLEVQSTNYNLVAEPEMNAGLMVQQNPQLLQIIYRSENKVYVHLRIYNLSGRLIYKDDSIMHEGLNTKVIDKHLLGKGLVLIGLLLENKRLNQKTLLF
ncbi:MAG TPA: metallophosphoesterase [Prolixibacteraceae bacterium]